MVLNIKVKGDNMEKRHSELGVLSFVSSILGLVCVGLIFICSIFRGNNISLYFLWINYFINYRSFIRIKDW